MPDQDSQSGASLPDGQRLLDQAQEFHRGGQLEAAENLYLEILAKTPDDFVVLHLLGVLKNQRQDFESALEFLARALELNPRSALAHLNMGNALWGLGRAQEALGHFQHSLRFGPDQPDALLNCAAALAFLERPAEALTRLDRLVSLQPGFIQAHMNRGIVLDKLDRSEEAVACYQLVLADHPDDPDVLTNLGNALLHLDRPEEALARYRQALAIHPGHVEAMENKDNPLLHSRIALKSKLEDLWQNSSRALAASRHGGQETPKVLFLMPHFVTGKDWTCGEYPLEADLYFHFKQSFQALGYALVEPKWNFQGGRIFIDKADLSRLLDEERFSCCMLEINFETSDKYAPTVWFKDPDLVEKLRQRIGCVITFIGDAYPRGKIVEVIEAAHAVSTVVWCPYQGARGMLQLMDRPDLVGKIDTTPAVPTVFTESTFTKFPENKAYEVSYIGTSKRIRLNAIAEFCRLDNVKMFVNTTTRDFNSLNDAKPMQYFLDILQNSVSTITSTARTPDPMPTAFEGVQAKYPEVFSGRFVEAISRGCMPIYIARDGQDFPPLPNLQQGTHYFRVEQVHEYNITLRALRGIDRNATIRALRDYHAAYLSPQAMLAPILERHSKGETFVG